VSCLPAAKAKAYLKHHSLSEGVSLGMQTASTSMATKLDESWWASSVSRESVSSCSSLDKRGRSKSVLSLSLEHCGGTSRESGVEVSPLQEEVDKGC
jgi:hypothetical protein